MFELWNQSIKASQLDPARRPQADSSSGKLGGDMLDRGGQDGDELGFAQSPCGFGAADITSRPELQHGGRGLEHQPGHVEAGAQHIEERGAVGLVDEADGRSSAECVSMGLDGIGAEGTAKTAVRRTEMRDRR